MTLSEDINKLEQEHNDLKELCGEILATLTLEKNVKTFEELPSQWHELVIHWKLWYGEIVGITVTRGDVIPTQININWATVPTSLEDALIEEIEELERQ